MAWDRPDYPDHPMHDWKKPVEVELKGNILSIQTKDLHWKQYKVITYPVSDGEGGTLQSIDYRRYPSGAIIKDAKELMSLPKYREQALSGKYTKRRGWVKSLR